jgi:uncharacterized integral membrane protein
MKENVKIITNEILRDSRTERRIIEMNRERFIYMILLVGAILLLLALLW